MSLLPLDQLLSRIGLIGQFMSGIGLIVAAAGGLWALHFVQGRTLEMAWTATFRALYAEFWNDDQMASVRKWIVSEEEYSKLGELITKRLASEKNLLNSEENDKLEKIDRFISLMVRIKLLGKRGMNDPQKKLHDLLYDHWIGKVKARTELNDYVGRFWRPHGGLD